MEVVALKKYYVSFVLFILLIIFFACSNKQDLSVVVTPSKDEKIFIEELRQESNHNYRFDIVDNCIYKENIMTDEKSFFLSEVCNIMDMILYDETLYYVIQKDELVDIYSISIDGIDKKVVMESCIFSELKNHIFRSWEIYGGKIYIQTNLAFFEFDLNNQTLKELHKDVWIYEIYNNELYFIDHANRTFTIYKMNLDTKKVEVVLGDGKYNPDKSVEEYYSNFVITDTGNLIYTKRNPYGVYYYNKSNLLIESGNQILEYSLACHYDSVYYVVKDSENYNLVVYNLNSEERSIVTVLKDYSAFVDITNSFYYYATTDGSLSKVEIAK